MPRCGPRPFFFHFCSIFKALVQVFNSFRSLKFFSPDPRLNDRTPPPSRFISCGRNSQLMRYSFLSNAEIFSKPFRAGKISHQRSSKAPHFSHPPTRSPPLGSRRIACRGPSDVLNSLFNLRNPARRFQLDLRSDTSVTLFLLGTQRDPPRQHGPLGKHPHLL